MLKDFEVFAGKSFSALGKIGILLFCLYLLYQIGKKIFYYLFMPSVIFFVCQDLANIDCFANMSCLSKISLSSFVCVWIFVISIPSLIKFSTEEKR
jgi:hypothetical protein